MRKPFIVAEIGANHCGSLDEAFLLVHEAMRAGADAVKFQTFTPEQMAEPGVKLDSGPWAGRELLDLYRQTHTPREWHRHLFGKVRLEDGVPFASVFHPDDVDFLETLDCPIYKIASFELTDTDLIRHAAKTGRSLIFSAGMAEREELDDAIETAYRAGCAGLTVLKCTSAYPAQPSEANLAVMEAIKRAWPYVDVGLSDHTQGLAVAVAATALGASVIEKHFTLDRSNGSPDAAFSMEPDEFRQMAIACRQAAAAIGQSTFGPTASEASSLPLRRKPGGKRGD